MLSFLAGCAVTIWVMWSRHMHRKPLSPLHGRHHHHWLHSTGELPRITAKDHHAKE